MRQHYKDITLAISAVHNKVINQCINCWSYILVIVIVLSITHLSIFLIDLNTYHWVYSEDGVIENLTAGLFLLSAIIFGLSFIRYRRIFYIVFALIFFIAFGEEISWGQRILGFSTPASLASINVQGELNLHNLELFNAYVEGGEPKVGLDKIFSITFLYKIFWLVYGIMIPLLFLCSERIRNLTTAWGIAVAPIVIGIFFLINWAIMKLSMQYAQIAFSIYPDGLRQSSQGHYLMEIYEFSSSLIFLCTSIYFYRQGIPTEPKNPKSQ